MSGHLSEELKSDLSATDSCVYLPPCRLLSQSSLLFLKLPVTSTLDFEVFPFLSFRFFAHGKCLSDLNLSFLYHQAQTYLSV